MDNSPSPLKQGAGKSTNHLSALKIISKDKLHPDDVKIIRGEAKVLEMLEGLPHIVQLRNFYETRHHILIEMEYLQGG